MKRPNRYAVRIGLCALCLAFAVVLCSHGQPPVVAVKEIEQLVEQDAKAIQATLAKPKFDKKAQAKVKAAAMMIAQYAQAAAAKDNGLKYFALRDQALKLVKAASEGNADEAKKLAGELSVNMKADPNTKAMMIDLHKHSDLLTIMKQFSIERFGGNGLEAALEEAVALVGAPSDKQATDIALLANKISMIAHLANSYAPETDQNEKTKKNWEAFSVKMQTTAIELAKAAQAKDAEVSKIADRLSMTCVKCHDVFRIKE